MTAGCRTPRLNSANLRQLPQSVLSIGLPLSGLFEREQSCETLHEGVAAALEAPPELTLVNAGSLTGDCATRQSLKALGEIRPLVLIGMGDEPSLLGLADLSAERLTRDNALALWLEAQARWLRQRERAFHAAVDSLGQLAGGTSHDLNNVLSVVIGNLELIGMTVTDPTLLDMLSSAEAASARCSSLAQRLSRFTNRDESREQCSVNALASAFVRKAQEESAGRYNFNAVLDEACEAVTLHLRSGRIQQILDNLADNAIDATAEGGTIEITTSNEPLGGRLSRHAILTDRVPSPCVRICVRDQGHGMSAATLSRAGDLYFSTRNRGRTAGIGLSVAAAFAEREGGAVVVESREDLGTTAHLLLPLRDP